MALPLLEEIEISKSRIADAASGIDNVETLVSQIIMRWDPQCEYGTNQICL